MKKNSFIESELENRRSQNLLRGLRTISPISGIEIDVDGRTMLNFCSNDYLGLSRHPLLRQRAAEFMEKYGAGSTASRLVCGTYDCFEQVENKIAYLKGSETALILNSGYQTNVSLLPALADRETLILSDWLNHNSIIQGSLLARCRVERFHHNDPDHLKRLLKENQDSGISRVLIITESVFSMDGDQSDIDALVKLAEEFQALLIVDDSHATGVLGKRGMGLTCGKNVDITMGTFGKACGSFGSYIACSKKIRDYLINFCYGFIYTTALPPSIIGSIDAALELIPTMEKERLDLLKKADHLRSSLHEMGFDTGDSSAQIIPVIIGDEEETLALSKQLEEDGILALAFRPPTVAKGESIIRLSLSALHTQEHLEQLIDIFRRWRG
ncbi:MAG: 8-amino-7-oxononanoate synthase [Deltaproteobacteria bacterium]|nr:8-amino-7-oxononanoate synthase [Deltaproteobacteria bacterium]